MPGESKSSGALDTQVATTTSVREEKTKITNPQGEDELQRTIFISNLPFEITVEEVKQRFSAFGGVETFMLVLHPVTKRPRGTGFLKFTTKDAVSAALSAANTVAGLGILIKGRPVKVLKALVKKTANDKALDKAKKDDSDHHNVYLVSIFFSFPINHFVFGLLFQEGYIMDGMPAAEGVSASDMAKRKKLHEDKMSKLQSPNFRIKILKDSKVGKEGEKSRPRGVAFLEFTEHQHALVALRVLNNNPDIFGPEHRPIVEFALDNVQKLKLRAEKIQAQQLQGPQDASGNFRQNDHLGRGGSIANSNSRIRKSRDGDASMRTYDNKRGELASKAMVAEQGGNKQQKGPRKVAKSRVCLPKKKSSMKASDQGNGRESGGLELIPSNAVTKREGRDAGVPRIRMSREQLEQSTEGDGGELNRKRRNDVTDKLIEPYRNKFTGSSW
ncbi:hypothetical protein SASPL_104493 [Salvia splendens]|uniref:RRM domain-containing protein n=1 Tax=Salvia splendens TaxID=180675 RepID=A0A8X8YNP8_SALSN|nr:hypothetical protein SASPL_104493 [Salvia splendens]